MTTQSAQGRAIDSGFLDLMGESQSNYSVPTFDQMAKSLGYLAKIYEKKLKDKLRAKDADSSGALSDSILALPLKVMGTVYSVEISAKKYASFIDEGVDGWAKSQGSPYKFRTKGVNPDSDMVKSIKAWLIREGKMSRNRSVLKYKSLNSAREERRVKITDRSTAAAVSAAYMIKRQGIKPTHFWTEASDEFNAYVIAEMGAALRIDIIQNLN